METLISLQYANGRIYETTYTGSETLEPGREFDLYGRHWRVVGLARQPSRRGPQVPPRMVCIAADAP